jgi:PAB-dependent poly(A)-specific ribonuclease subunit 2
MLQAIDLSSGTPGGYQQLDVNSYVTCMSISPTGEYLAFGDADGQLHLWTTKAASGGEDVALPPFNGYEGIKPEWVDASDPPPVVEWTETTYV